MNPGKSDSGYATKLVMHLNFGSQGHGYIYELTDYPGIQVTRQNDKKAKKMTQVVSYNNEIYEKISEAVMAWRFDHG